MTSKSRDQRSMEQQDRIHELKHEQAFGKPEMVTANRNPNYKIKKLEAEGYVHVLTRMIHPQPNKTNTEIDSIQLIHKAQFDQKLKENVFQLYDYAEVLHDPRENAPSSYEVKTLANATPAKEAASVARTDNSQLRERQKQLSEREKALEAREAALAEREASSNAKKSSKE